MKKTKAERRLDEIMSRRHPPCDHPRREPAKVVPGFSCPDCGAVFQVRK